MGMLRDGQAPDVYMGVNPVERPPIIRAQRNPTTADRRYKKGSVWINESGNNVYCLTSVSGGSANWEALGGPGIAVESVAGDSGTAVPSDGVLTLAGTAPISSAASGSTTTYSLDANGVTSAYLAENTIQYATVSLTAAEIKALATTPIELVAAPGAGKVIHFALAMFKLVAGSEVLAEAGDNLGIKYTDASGVQVCTTVEMTGFIDQAANTYTNALPQLNAIVAATGAENQALVLDNLGSNFTGNASDDATLEVAVSYRVHTL